LALGIWRVKRLSFVTEGSKRKATVPCKLRCSLPVKFYAVIYRNGGLYERLGEFFFCRLKTCLIVSVSKINKWVYIFIFRKRFVFNFIVLRSLNCCRFYFEKLLVWIWSRPWTKVICSYQISGLWCSVLTWCVEHGILYWLDVLTVVFCSC